MVPWRNVLVGVLALMTAASHAVAQASDLPPAPQLSVIADPRIDEAVAAGLEQELRAADLAFRVVGLPEECGAVPGPVAASDTSVFDLDSALRAAADETASGSEAPLATDSILVIAHGSPECLSIACTLAASLKHAQPSLSIDVLSTAPDGSALECVADNTGGQFKTVTLAELPSVALAMLEKTRKDAATAAASPVATPLDQRATEASDSAEATDSTADASINSADESAALPPVSPPETVVSAPIDRPDFPPLPKPRPNNAAGMSALALDTQGERNPGQETEAAKPFQWATEKPSAPESEKPPPAPKAPGVMIRVLAGPKGPLIEVDLSYEILSPEGSGASRRVGQSVDPNPFFPLPKGRYLARVAHGKVVREFPFVTSGQGVDHHVFSLDIGYLSLQVRPSSGGAPLESGISYTVSRLGSGGSAGAAILTRREAQPMIALPAGGYRVLVQSEGAKQVTDITLEPGEMHSHAFNLNLGYLRVSVAGDVDYVDDVTLRVEQVATNGESNSKVRATQPGDTALFRLPAGQYIASAASSGGHVDQRVTVDQGKLSEVVLDMQTAAQEPPEH